MLTVGDAAGSRPGGVGVGGVAARVGDAVDREWWAGGEVVWRRRLQLPATGDGDVAGSTLSVAALVQIGRAHV